MEKVQEADGFQIANGSGRNRQDSMKATNVVNSFEALRVCNQEDILVGQVNCDTGEELQDRRGDSPIEMDSFTCWNIRGLNCLRKQKDVKKFLIIKSLGLVSLIEKTKVKEKGR